MARFQEKRSPSVFRSLQLSVCMFVLIFALFFFGISHLSEDTVRRQKETLENALNRSITYCYAVEGAYPQSLDYLKTNYGITYNEDLFFVDYRISGANIFPDVTYWSQTACIFAMAFGVAPVPKPQVPDTSMAAS